MVFDGELENWPPERINLLQDTRHGGEEDASFWDMRERLRADGW